MLALLVYMMKFLGTLVCTAMSRIQRGKGSNPSSSDVNAERSYMYSVTVLVRIKKKRNPRKAIPTWAKKSVAIPARKERM